MEFKNSPLRTLARSNKWQTIYARAKDLNINLFNNVADFTAIQIEFMYWLELYHTLYTDLGMNEPLISNDVIEDDIRTDAYLLYRSRIKFKKDKQVNKNKPRANVNIGQGSVVFT
ncbi:MAG: hypothetical protein ACTSPD_10460 [Promethearchaeota archaeon]